MSRSDRGKTAAPKTPPAKAAAPRARAVAAAARPDLRLVPCDAEVYDLMRATETTAERIQRLQAEARALAVEEIEALERLLDQAAAKARDIAAGGDAYPVGARELAGRLADDLPARAETLRAIMARQG